MCWNAKVSLESFGIGIFAIVLAAFSGVSFPALLFYASIVFMQLIEYIMWQWGVHDPDINFGASIAAVGLLCLQPLASILTLKQPGFLVGAYVILGLLYSLLRWVLDRKPMREHYQMKPGADGHLEWKWLQADALSIIGLVIYMVFLFVPLIISKNVEVLFIVLATLAISLYSYGTQRTWGSMWCWIVNWMVVVVGIRAFLKF